jgi:hypothetical protein
MLMVFSHASARQATTHRPDLQPVILQRAAGAAERSEPHWRFHAPVCDLNVPVGTISFECAFWDRDGGPDSAQIVAVVYLTDAAPRALAESRRVLRRSNWATLDYKLGDEAMRHLSRATGLPDAIRLSFALVDTLRQ